MYIKYILAIILAITLFISSGAKEVNMVIDWEDTVGGSTVYTNPFGGGGSVGGSTVYAGDGTYDPWSGTVITPGQNWIKSWEKEPTDSPIWDYLWGKGIGSRERAIAERTASSPYFTPPGWSGIQGKSPLQAESVMGRVPAFFTQPPSNMPQLSAYEQYLLAQVFEDQMKEGMPLKVYEETPGQEEVWINPNTGEVVQRIPQQIGTDQAGKPIMGPGNFPEGSVQKQVATSGTSRSTVTPQPRTPSAQWMQRIQGTNIPSMLDYYMSKLVGTSPETLGQKSQAQFANKGRQVEWRIPRQK